MDSTNLMLVLFLFSRKVRKYEKINNSGKA